MKLLPKIDIHVHTTLHKSLSGERPEYYASCDELVAMYDRLNVEYGILLPEVNPEGGLICSIEDTMGAVAKYPDRFGFFMNIDPRQNGNSPQADFSFQMDYYKRHGAKGIGEVCANLYFDDPRCMNLFAQAEKHELPIIFHMGYMGNDYGLVDEVGLHRFEKVLQAFPKLKFLGHSQKFWAEIGSDVTEESRGGYPTGKVDPGRLIELLDKYPNLNCDISAGSGYNAITRDPDFGPQFLEKYQDRIFFGTDICSPTNVVRHGELLDSWVQAGKISYLAYEKISRENALQLLGR